MWRPPLVFVSLSFFLLSVLFVCFFDVLVLRVNRLEGRVPVSTVSTPSGRRTRPWTSESGAPSRAAVWTRPT